MQFIKTTDNELGSNSLYQRLAEHLERGNKVLWLVSGGSNIDLSVAIMQRLSPSLTANLSILLADERFGPVGHPDSNATQLLAAGFNHKQATILPILLGVSTLDDSIRRYEDLARQAFSEADYVIGQFGIGSDGHIAGILPGSPAVSSRDFVAAYQSNPYTRLTLTARALKRISVAFVFAYGDDKREALEKLRDSTLSYDAQPSQILKELPEAYVYNNQLGGTEE
ncbi:MAG: 6-phosphogluconolactonase [Candidatus Saccharibacteria bacterium]